MVYCIIVMIMTVAADRITKFLTLAHLADGTLRLIPGVLHLTYVENRGAAFGMLANHRWVFLIISALAIIVLLAFLIIKKPKDRLLCTSIALIAGGGIGNMIDRVFRGYVVDMIEAAFIDFPVFNVADTCVCVGCGLLLLYMILDEVKSRRAAKDEKTL